MEGPDSFSAPLIFDRCSRPVEAAVRGPNLGLPGLRALSPAAVKR